MAAAIYARSSKDRSDVSIDAQRRELAALAKTRQLNLVAEFTDAVESGKDEDRPGFQSLLRAIQNPRRGWDTLLVLDTARISRRILHAVIFEEQTCKQAGVRIVYKSLPDSDPVTEMLLKSVLRAMDEWHSMTSRAKGLAGMRENVKQGFRAGGRAPLGYVLQPVETGAVREGLPVRKSRLALGPDAARVQAYLRARAKGIPRAEAGAGLQLNESSMVGMEWNALTYAGHTLWNVHAEHGSGRKRRPRAEWVIQRDTHPALVVEADAERIIAKLEAYAPTRSRQRNDALLLVGLLVTPAGVRFRGDRGAYRAMGRSIQAARVDHAVAGHVLEDLQSSAFVRAITKAARSMKPPDGVETIRDALQDVETRLGRLVSLLERSSSPAPLLRKMEVLEAERVRLSDLLADADADAAQRNALSRITEHEVRRLLVERAAQIQEADPEAMREALHGLLKQVELDGDELRIHYRFDRFKLASPREGEPKAVTVVMNHRLVA